MNGYKIDWGGVTYVTNADSFEEAEEKFLEKYDDASLDSYTIDQEEVEVLKKLDAVFF